CLFRLRSLQRSMWSGPDRNHDDRDVSAGHAAFHAAAKALPLRLLETTKKMRRLLAAISAACLCASVFSASMAHAASGDYRQPMTKTSSKTEATSKEKVRKTSGKRKKGGGGNDVVVG